MCAETEGGFQQELISDGTASSRRCLVCGLTPFQLVLEGSVSLAITRNRRCGHWGGVCSNIEVDMQGVSSGSGRLMDCLQPVGVCSRDKVSRVASAAQVIILGATAAQYSKCRHGGAGAL